MLTEIRNHIKGHYALYNAASTARSWTTRMHVAILRATGRPLTDALDLPENLKPQVETEAFKYELTACLKFKNEARFLDEWIRFHHLVGIEHFYLYNNNSTDDYKSVLEPHIKSGIVTLHDWPVIPAFPSANVHCARTYRNEARWIAFLDADEFLFGTSEDDLRSILKDYTDHPAVVVNWLYFGNDGHDERPSGYVIKNYTRRENAVNAHVKSIVNPRHAIKAVTTHYWLYCGFRLAVNEKCKTVVGGFSRPPSVDRLRINHYVDKSKQDFMEKCGGGFVDEAGHRGRSGRRLTDWEKCCRNHNQIVDLTIGRFFKRME